MIQENESKVWQIVFEDRYSIPVLHSWYMTKEQADEMLADLKRCFPDTEYYLEQGTEHINEKCRGCETIHCSERFDYHGITTGCWCEDCYQTNYPYRKDDYFDPGYAGERLEEDY
jgi:hypothetical protein